MSPIHPEFKPRDLKPEDQEKAFAALPVSDAGSLPPSGSQEISSSGVELVSTFAAWENSINKEEEATTGVWIMCVSGKGSLCTIYQICQEILALSDTPHSPPTPLGNARIFGAYGTATPPFNMMMMVRMITNMMMI